jgi:hypothetical protein
VNETTGPALATCTYLLRSCTALTFILLLLGGPAQIKPLQLIALLLKWLIASEVAAFQHFIYLFCDR